MSLQPNDVIYVGQHYFRSYQYKKSNCGDKTILRQPYLHDGISYTGKATYLYQIGALMSVRTKVWFQPVLTHRQYDL